MKHGKLFTVLQIATILSGAVAYSITTPIIGYAEEKEDSDKSDKSDDKKDKKDDSAGEGMTAIEKKVGERMNAFNGDLPEGFGDGITQGPGRYNVGTQAVMTYSILRDKWGSGDQYKEIYKTGKDQIDSFKKAAPGVKVENEMGTDTVVSQATESKQKDNGGNQDKQSKATMIETSSFPTDNAKDKNSWLKKHEKDGLAKLAMQVGNKLGDNANAAVAMGGSQRPFIRATYQTDAAKGDNHGSFMDHIEGAKKFAGMIGRNKSSNLTAQWRAAMNMNSNGVPYSIDDSYETDGTGIFKPDDRSKGNMSNTYSGSTGDHKSDFEDAFSVQVMSKLASAKDINSKKDLEKTISGMSAKEVANQSGFNDDFNELNHLPAAANAGYPGTVATRIYGDKEKSSTANQAEKDAASIMSVFDPSVIPNLKGSGSGGAFYSNYQAKMNAKSGISVTDEQWKAFKKYQDASKKNADDIADATKGVSILTWSPAVIYDDSHSSEAGKVGKQNKEVGEGFIREKGFWKNTSNKQYRTIDGSLINTKGDKNPISSSENRGADISLGGGGKDTIISDNKKPIDVTAVGSGDYKNVAPDWKSDTDIYGYDSYGNIMDGVNMKVAIPYWHNDTNKLLAQKTQYGAAQADLKPSATPPAEANVTDSQIGSVAPKGTKAYKNATKVRDAIKQGGTSSRAKFNSTVNSAVGDSGSTLSDKGAASLAVVVTAGTANDVKKYNEDFLKKSAKAKQLYLGKSVEKKDDTAKSSKGTSLYTAADIIQRVGLMTDIGQFDMFRKTVVSLVVNTYNNSIIQDGKQEIFYTPTFDDSGDFTKMGLAPFAIAILLLEFVILCITCIQYFVLRTVTIKAFITRTAKFIAFALIFSFLHTFENVFLNKPVEIFANRPLKQEFVIDHWSKLKQQKDLSNVFYSGLMGDNNYQLNNSTSYMIPFYTSTDNNGTMVATVTDPKSKQGQKVHPENYNKGKLDPASGYNTLKGNGDVRFGTQYKFKKVYVSSLDLVSWASHMARQKLSANGKIQKGSDNFEAPKEGYGPGTEPLFEWLANDYEPIGGEQTGKVQADWGKEIRSAAKAMGTSINDDQVKMLNSLIHHESTGNDEAENGNGASGLVQWMPGTFNVYKLKGHGNIKNGTDSLLAFFNMPDWQHELAKTGGNGNWGPDPRKRGVHKSVPNPSALGESGDKDSSDDKKDDSDSDSKGDDYGGDDDYGKIRNPADTTPKSGLGKDKQTNAVKIDNSALYKHYDKYAEYAVNTKHFAGDFGKKTGDVDSSGGLMTASDAFLDLWTSIFENSGSGRNPGNAESFTSLMNLAQAINGNMSNQTKVGTDENDLNVNNVGAVGRKDLINEISMTKEQRNALNGGTDGKFSDAAKKMIHAFKIPAGKSDYFNLADKDSTLNKMMPYAKGKDEDKMGIIYDLNKTVLNDYISDYSVVRASINPSGSNSTDSDENDQTRSNSVDPFTMAEDHAVALDMYFEMNKKLHYKMFPTMYSAKTVSLDSWNKIMFIPIGDLSNKDDDSQYNRDDQDPSPVRMQDNPAEYLGLRSNMFVLILFIIMNYMLVLFGVILGIIFKWFIPIMLLGEFVRNFVRVNEDISIKGIMSGTVGATILFGVWKAVLIILISFRSSQMNNAYINDGGYKSSQTLQTEFTIIIFLAFFFWFFLKVYIPMLKNNIRNLGASDGGGFFGNLKDKSKSAYDNGFAKKMANKGKDKFMTMVAASSGLAGVGAKAGKDFIKRRVAEKAANINKKYNPTNGKYQSIRRKLKDMKLVQGISNGGWFPKSNKPDGLSSRVNNLMSAEYGAVDETMSDGIDRNDVIGLSNGEHVDNTDKGSLRWKIPSDMASSIDKDSLMQNGFSVIQDSDGQDYLKKDTNNLNMINKINSRKELFNDLLKNINTELNTIDGMVGHVDSLQKKYIPTMKNSVGQYELPVDAANGVDPSKLDAMLNDQDFKNMFDVISKPMNVNGRQASGTLTVVPKGSYGNNEIQTIASDFIGKKFNQPLTNAITVGDHDDLISGMMTPGMFVSDGKLFYNQDSQTQSAAISGIQNKLNNTVVKKNKDLSNLSTGITDYVLNGNDAGLGSPDIQKQDNDFTTKRYLTNNPYNTREGINGLKNLGTKLDSEDLFNKANSATKRFDNGLMQAYGNENNLSRAYMAAVDKSNINLTPELNDSIRQLDGSLKAVGQTGYDNASQRQKLAIDKSLNGLRETLKANGDLNTIQNTLLNNSDMEIDGARELSSVRDKMLQATGVPDAIYNKLTVDQLANLSTTVGGDRVDIDDNGIASFDIDKRFDRPENDSRISDMLRLLS